MPNLAESAQHLTRLATDAGHLARKRSSEALSSAYTTTQHVIRRNSLQVGYATGMTLRMAARYMQLMLLLSTRLSFSFMYHCVFSIPSTVTSADYISTHCQNKHELHPVDHLYGVSSTLYTISGVIAFALMCLDTEQDSPSQFINPMNMARYAMLLLSSMGKIVLDGMLVSQNTKKPNDAFAHSCLYIAVALHAIGQLTLSGKASNILSKFAAIIFIVAAPLHIILTDRLAKEQASSISAQDTAERHEDSNDDDSDKESDKAERPAPTLR